MKKHLLFISLTILLCVNGYAATHTVSVMDNSFSPQTLTVTQGDDIVFDFSGASNPHNVTSDNGAWTALTTTGTINTTSLAAGTYAYHCTIHGGIGTGMYGSFTVQTSGSAGLLSSEETGMFSAYPNPVENIMTLSVKNNAATRIDVVKILTIEGKEVASYTLSSFGTEHKIDLSALSEGFYLCRIYSAGAVLDTRKIMKKK